VERKKNQQ